MISSYLWLIFVFASLLLISLLSFVFFSSFFWCFSLLFFFFFKWTFSGMNDISLFFVFFFFSLRYKRSPFIDSLVYHYQSCFFDSFSFSFWNIYFVFRIEVVSMDKLNMNTLFLSPSSPNPTRRFSLVPPFTKSNSSSPTSTPTTLRRKSMVESPAVSRSIMRMFVIDKNN